LWCLPHRISEGTWVSKKISRPPGTEDRIAGDAELQSAMVRQIMHVSRAHGYRAVDVPTFETYEIFAKLYGDAIRGRLLTFTTDREYALRPDLTAGICRMAVAGLGDTGGPISPLRYASAGPAYRHERPSPLRQREFTQFGIERIGDGAHESAGADVEILSLARLVMQQAGLAGGLLRVGHVQVRARLLAAISQDPALRDKLGTVLDATARLRARLDPPKTGVDAFADGPEARGRVVPAEHPDIGNFMVEITRLARTSISKETLASTSRGPGALLAAFEGELASIATRAGVDEAGIEALFSLTRDAASPGELADWAKVLWPGAEEALAEGLDHIASCTTDFEPLVLRFSLAAVRGLGYYTGFTFEVDVPALGPDVSQVMGGGRYDGVTAALGGPSLRAAGFAVGIERLLAAAKGLAGEADLMARLTPPPPVLVCFGDGDSDAAKAARFGERLRDQQVSLAFHPTPVTDVADNGLSPAMMQALSDLPGRPYRRAVLVARGRWFVGYLDEAESFATERNEALTLLSHRV
jgi:histidyl-tRNA synthetase